MISFLVVRFFDRHVIGKFHYEKSRPLYLKYQISKLNQCQLTRIGSLPFPFYWGGCANMGNRRIFLCFDQDNRKTCHYAEDPVGNYHKIYTSKYEHRGIRVAASPGNGTFHGQLFDKLLFR